MVRRRTWLSFIVLAGAALAVIALLRLTGCKTGGEGEKTVVDMAVHVGKIARATLHRYVLAYGNVEAEPAFGGKPSASASIASPLSGVIAQIYCTEGLHVTKGTVLFRLDKRLAEIAFQRAKEALNFARQNYDRQKALFDVEGTSKKSYLDAQQQLVFAQNEMAGAETDLRLLTIEAPLTGTLVKINVEPGEAVELNTVLAEIIDLNRLVVSARIPSREAVLLKTGQTVDLGAGDIGILSFIGQQINSATDTVPVRISIPQPAGFSPGRFLRVRILTEEHVNCLAVPEASVIMETVAGDTGEIVVVEGNKAVRRSVKIGLREAGLVEVEAEGVKEGMVIVTEDAYAVPDQTKIHIVD